MEICYPVYTRLPIDDRRSAGFDEEVAPRPDFCIKRETFASSEGLVTCAA